MLKYVFIQVCFSHSACQDAALVEAVLSLTITGSRQHVAVIKSKDIGEKKSRCRGEYISVVTLPAKKRRKKSWWLKGKCVANKMTVEETHKELSPVQKCFCSPKTYTGVCVWVSFESNLISRHRTCPHCSEGLLYNDFLPWMIFVKFREESSSLTYSPSKNLESCPHLTKMQD